MSTSSSRHEHVPAVTHAIRRRNGVPYEVERTVCSVCGRVLDEKPVKRLTAV